MHENGREVISLTLSPTQVDEVLRAAAQSRVPTVSTLIAETLATDDLTPERSAGHMPHHSSDRRLSRSLLRGLSILTAFGASSEERGIVELSRDLGMSASTTHRYALTLVELGLLERCPRSRKYRLPEVLMG